MGERRGTKALELWCRRITDGYPGVNVQNMTTSWRDGLAFCAMIHHFRPDLIDFNSLNKDDVYRNNELAFRTAEQHLGIPALLDAEDMASCMVPDRLSILTYLSQFYQTFGGSSPSRLATNRTTESADDRIAPVPESPKQKVGSRLGMRRDPCAACGLPVFLAEKLLIARAPYHRTCFRCARCCNQLTPGNYYETEEGQYCCETCPDEEETDSVRHKYAESTMSDTERQKNEPRSLSDEEKTERKNFSKDFVRVNNEDRLNKDKPHENSAKVRSIERRKDNFTKIENERIENNKMDEEHYENAMGSSVLSAKGINLSENENYPEDLNPFKSDEEDNAAEEGKSRTVINSSKSNKVSTNPFDSEDEDMEEPEPPKPAIRNKPENRGTSVTKRVLAAPQINLNPFWSDEEEERGSDEENRDRTPSENVPVPKPRTIKTTPEVNIVRRVDLDRGGLYASNSSLTSSESTTTPGGTYRKKKPAPQPPVAKELFPSNQHESPILKSHISTLPSYYDSSPRTTPRARKTKPAPPPPMPTSTPRNISVGKGLSLDESPIIKLRNDDRNLNMWEDQKTNKDEANRNRQSLSSISCTDSSSYMSYTDKSVQGKWKRKKGPAPPRPIPHRRKIKVISMKDVKLELDKIELQQQGLERQGVRLEQLIRDKCESGPRTDDSSLGTDVEELVLELFTLVNEKNELFRRQAELMLLRRQQRLEEEHVEVEYQIRCLMCQPEATKTDFDKQREEALIQRLVEIVERRNEIVECLEMDRRREVEEDKSINKHMGLFAARNKNELANKGNDSSNAGKTKKGKTKEKIKEKKLKKVTKKDADKDVDETEVKLKRHGKRKWF
ncbi:MICAL-like protein 2 [Trachymyrmex septentrionalis]|uniref:MICAL-like protein 2 n=1 Tax=Trachymyrmex septentrionalis TaxID=34720 RepID=A0A195FL19_9HYME|nr:MICAL-like protein 2 [Trachymyrmex septentrionalis]